MTRASDALRLTGLALILGVWILLAGGALLAANALDNPVGAGARDEAQPAVPAVPAVPGGPATGSGGSLPPLALVLDRPLPNVVADLDAPIRQAAVLKSLATATAQPRRYVELGSVLQLLGDGDGAGNAYDTALLLDPSNLAAKAGLALVEAANGGTAQQQGAARLRALAAANPSSQPVAFNEGWLAIYRRDAEGARTAVTRTVALGQDTRLGRTAATLLASLENGAGGRNP